MPKEKTVRTVIRVPESIHACMQEQAREAGYDDGRGPGLAKYLISLHVAHVDELGRCYADLIADAFPKPVEVVPDVVTFEGMTPGEQWSFLLDVSIREWTSDVVDKAYELSAIGNGVGFAEKFDAALEWGSRSAPGYQARYDVTLAYVKGVMCD
jgi:hypothetical protein